MSGPYCSQCGEKKLSPKDHSLPHFAEEVLGTFTHLDSKFFRTVKLLFSRPGELSNAYFKGGRSRYSKPLTLFVIINVVFFLIQPHTSLLRYKYAAFTKNNPHYAAVVRRHLAETKESEQSYIPRFDATLHNQKKSLLIFSVPLLALVMALLLIGTRHMYVEHLVFSVQVYAFFLAFLLTATGIVFLLTAVVRSADPQAKQIISFLGSEELMTALTITVLTIYMFFGLRRAYELGKLRAAVTAFALAWTVGYLTGIYHNVLFYATYWAT